MKQTRGIGGLILEEFFSGHSGISHLLTGHHQPNCATCWPHNAVLSSTKFSKFTSPYMDLHMQFCSTKKSVNHLNCLRNKMLLVDSGT